MKCCSLVIEACLKVLVSWHRHLDGIVTAVHRVTYYCVDRHISEPKRL